MSDDAFVIAYEFSQPGISEPTRFVIRLHPQTLALLSDPPTGIPDWARLAFHKCPNCPLSEEEAPACPVALRLSHVVSGFADVFSFAAVSVRVTVPERAYVKENIPVQAALSSLIGIYMVTSGCPVLGTMKPMVRFHLPFASELETITRAVSMYLLGQYLVAQEGGAPDWTLAGLSESYQATAKVNRAFARRLNAAAPKDANANALIRLDSIARALPFTVESHLEELRFLYGMTPVVAGPT